MKRLAALTLPLVFESTLVGCPSSPAPDVTEASIDAVEEFPASCDATVPGRMCYEQCLHEFEDVTRPCVVFCEPIMGTAFYARCNPDDPHDLCTLTRYDAAAYVYCQPLG